ncbi:hypothetical protein GGI21_006632 [Coemansia aciculifera]|nr:hypothetical protein GGI21_006632 [Coemansia aciculifera]
MSTSEVIRSKQVVLATLCGAGGRDLKQSCGGFDIVIIDGATQAIESECWIAGLKASKLIIAGDHFQLPPMVKSIDSNRRSNASRGAASKLLQTTLFARMREKHGDAIACMLQTQYRMHADIMHVSSVVLYESMLVADDSVAVHTPSDSDGVEANALCKRRIPS